MIKKNVKRQVKTMRGVDFDMATVRAKHGNIKAIGNANMNARGDILDNTGKITITRAQIIEEYNKRSKNDVKHVTLKNTDADDFENPSDAIQRIKNKNKSDIAAKHMRTIVDKED